LIGLKDKNRDVRSRAALALVFVGDERAVEPLLEYLDKGYQSERGNDAPVIIALGRVGGERVIPTLIKRLGGDVDVQRAAAVALGMIGTSAVEPLIEVASSRTWSERGYAAEALGYIGDSRAVPVLLEILKNRGIQQFQAAAVALGRIGELSTIIILS